MKLKLDLPRPTGWDWAALAVTALGLALMGANVRLSGTSGGGSDLTLVFVFTQLAVCLGSLLLLGKTAKQGSIWGNLGAVAGTFVGMSGVLLAAALWVAA